MSHQRVRFLSGGDVWVRTADAIEDLARVVDHVVERLKERGVPKTPAAGIREKLDSLGEYDDLAFDAVAH